MAQMYPATFPPDSSSSGERIVYEALRTHLDSHYTVYFSEKWQALDPQRRPQDGETDFIITHPEHGILVLEVKGGGISYDPVAGKWYTLPRNAAARVGIKDPFEQGKKNKYSLLRLLQAAVQPHLRDIILGHTVAFPDVPLNQSYLGPDKPRDILLVATDLPRIADWVTQAYAYYRGNVAVDKALTARCVAALKDLLVVPIELKQVLWGEFQQEEESMLTLTQQQYDLLRELRYQRRALISGFAGSGKTMLAVEKARRLAKQGFSVLLTCFNKNLAADLRLRLGEIENVRIEHFHGLCSSLAQAAEVRVNPPRSNNDDDYYNVRLPNALAEAAGKLDLRFDAIVVDEGQDFHDDWWVALQMLLADPNDGILYIFYDDNQRIYTLEHDFPIKSPPYPLEKNCRNTQKIHQLVLKFYRGDRHELPPVQGPPGREAETIVYPANESGSATLAALLHRLTTEGGIPAARIVVLTPQGSENSYLWRNPPTGDVHLSDNWPPPSGMAFRSTIYAFKGLESDVIILTELEHISQPRLKRDALLYTAYSRASKHLILLCPDYGGESEPGLPPKGWF